MRSGEWGVCVVVLVVVALTEGNTFECEEVYDYLDYNISTTLVGDALQRKQTIGVCKTTQNCVHFNWTAPVTPAAGYRVGFYNGCDPQSDPFVLRKSACDFYGLENGCTELTSPAQPGRICCCGTEMCEAALAGSMGMKAGVIAASLPLIFSIFL